MVVELVRTWSPGKVWEDGGGHCQVLWHSAKFEQRNWAEARTVCSYTKIPVITFNLSSSITSK